MTLLDPPLLCGTMNDTALRAIRIASPYFAAIMVAMIRRVALFLFLLASLSTTAQHRESVTVEVIDVPVYVVSGKEPVRNLTRDDFELFVNGKRTAIEYFDTVGDAAPPGAAGARPVLRERRLFVLLFDLAFTS